MAVLTGPRRIEVRNLPLPPLHADDGLLKVEVNGLCGSDLEFFEGGLPGYPLPMALGHEPVGRVAAIGSDAAVAWGVQAGDRVVVNSGIRCGTCARCLAGGNCRSRSYGTIAADEPPGLWGGLATHMYLAPGSTLLKLAGHVPTEVAAFHNPLANGFEWVGQAGQAGPGATVAVLGAGPRGLACCLVARILGAAQVIWAGLPRDERRLALAGELGADTTVTITSDEPSELRDAIGHQVDVVVDTTPRSVSAVEQALTALAADGRLVLAGIKGHGKRLALELDMISMRRLSLVGPASKTEAALRAAVDAINDGLVSLDKVPTQAFALDQVAEAIAQLGRPAVDGPIHLRVEP
jgi:alcohol dehydrogenase